MLNRKTQLNLQIAAGGTGSILLIDDDPFLSFVICETLEHHGFHCVNVSNLEGLASVMVEGYEPCLVLTDLHISLESGCDVLRYFRSEARFMDVPVVLISSEDEAQVVAHEHQFSGFIHKKAIFSQLLSMIELMT